MENHSYFCTNIASQLKADYQKLDGLNVNQWYGTMSGNGVTSRLRLAEKSREE